MLPLALLRRPLAAAARLALPRSGPQVAAGARGGWGRYPPGRTCRCRDTVCQEPACGDRRAERQALPIVVWDPSPGHRIDSIGKDC